MDLQKELLAVFRIYQFSGFAPFTIPVTEPNQKRKWFISIGLLAVYLAALVVNDMITYKRFFEDEKSKLISYLSFLIITAMRVVALVNVCESFVERNQQIAFLQQFDRMDQLFSEELGMSFDYKKIRRSTYIWMGMWMFQLIILTGLILVDILAERPSIWMVFWLLILTLPLFLPSTRYSQIIHYIQLMEFCFEMINTKLDEFQCQTNRLNVNDKRTKISNQFDRPIYDDIVAMRRIYHILWQSSVQLNNMFRWSLILLIGASFFSIVVNYYRSLYWLLAPNSSSFESVITFFIWSIVHSFHFITLSSVCHNISKQVWHFYGKLNYFCLKCGKKVHVQAKFDFFSLDFLK